MRHKPFLITLAAALLFFTFGWYKSSIDASSIPTLSDEWPASSDINVAQPASLYLTMMKAIKNSQFLPLPAGAVTAVTGRGPNGEILDPNDPLYVPPFPEIVSVSEINGEPRVHLRLDAETLLYAVAGEVLDSGWQLKTVDFTHVIAVFDDEEKYISIGYAQDDESVNELDETKADKE